MTVASVTTDINIGPYKIPSNAQNMIMNNYAQRNNISIEIVVPEPIMSDQLEIMLARLILVVRYLKFCKKIKM